MKRTGRAIGLSALVTILASGYVQAQSSSLGSSSAVFDDFRYSGRTDDTQKAGPDEYLNPVLSGYYPDPSLTRVGDDYYLVNSSFTNFPAIPVFHSKDLINWRQIGNAIDRPSQVDFTGTRSSQGIYAPDISYHDGLFYLVTTCINCKGNFVMTAKDPAGPWSDPVWFTFEGIDPSIFWDDDGKAYIVNNGAPAEKPRYDGHRAIWIQEFDYRNLKLVGERTLLVNGGVDISKKPIWIEGPHIFRKDGYYYLTAAEGGTGPDHSQVVLRATSPRGPFVPYENNPILTQRDLDPKRPHPVTSAGHAKLVQTPGGQWWATFLATRPYEGNHYNIGRETFLLPVTWKDGWPVILDKGQTIPRVAARPALPVTRPKTPPLTGDFSYVDTFDGDKLDQAWIGVRTPKTPFYTISDGKLRLSPGAAFGDLKGVPAFVARRQQHHDATISIKVTYTPQADGDRAGLAAYQSDQSNLFFGVTRIEGKNVIALYTRNKADTDTLVASAPVGAGPVTLGLKARGGRMDFQVTQGGKTRPLKEGVDVKLLSTESAGGFVGTIIGPYVSTSNKQ